MRRFSDTRLWDVLMQSSNHPSLPMTNLETLIGEFSEKLYTYCREEPSLAERIRTLGYARSEIAAALEATKNGSKKKCAFA
jgi:hypothetical protein